MGTNYDLRPPACECCGRYDEPLHIGKSHVSFEAHVDYGQDYDQDPVLVLTSWREWREFLEAFVPAGYRIFDEYGREVGLEEFIADVESSRSEDRRRQFDLMRQDPRWRADCSDGPEINMTWMDADGFSFTARSFS